MDFYQEMDRDFRMYIDGVVKMVENNDYPAMIARIGDSSNARILHAIMGIVTEAGELMDAYKKTAIYGKKLDTVNVMEEVGDLAWYIALLLDATGGDFGVALRMNADKLRNRFPEGFTEDKAIARDVGAERKILEEAAANSKNKDSKE